MDMNIKVVRQLEQACDPYRRMFKELREVRGSSQSQCFCKEKKNIKNTERLVWGGRSIIRGFSLFAGCLGISPP
jgi:hypothetical protein